MRKEGKKEDKEEEEKEDVVEGEEKEGGFTIQDYKLHSHCYVIIIMYLQNFPSF